jgi:hypothetical protein
MNNGNHFLMLRSLEAPEEFAKVLSGEYPEVLDGLVYHLGSGEAEDLPWALDALENAATPAPRELIPFMPVDDRSLACVVCKGIKDAPPDDYGKVVRWHLDDVPAGAQRQVLDVGIQEYLDTMVEDLSARERGQERISRIIERYDESHGASGTRPRHYHERPLRVAVQNVIIGQAAIRHDDMFNGLAASAWQTCQVPHVAAHEGNRALAALTLGEAFRSGGTMEIRFDKHPERRVPAVLRQFARTRGIQLGSRDPQAIHPVEARELMWAVTEMPDQLRNRLEQLTNAGHVTPERACFLLLSGVWLPIELEFLVATSGRLFSILEGRTDPLCRPARQAELAVCRAAHMLGVLFRLLSSPEGHDSVAREVPVHEDRRKTITWEMVPEIGAVSMHGEGLWPLPWTNNQREKPGNGHAVLVLPRHTLSDRDIVEASHRAKHAGAAVAFLCPQEEKPSVPGDTLLMNCPDALEAIDRSIERRLLASRVGRS